MTHTIFEIINNVQNPEREKHEPKISLMKRCMSLGSDKLRKKREDTIQYTRAVELTSDTPAAPVRPVRGPPTPTKRPTR